MTVEGPISTDSWSRVGVLEAGFPVLWCCGIVLSMLKSCVSQNRSRNLKPLVTTDGTYS